MRRRLAVGGVLFVGVLLVGTIAGALDGDPPAATGWWTDQPGAAAQPDGGFQVGGVGGQPVSVAAVRFSTPSGVTTATISLQESGGFVTPASSLQVCPTADPWEPANPGATADAPTPDCTNPIVLTRDAENLVWTAEVGQLLPSLGGEPSLMIVPGVEAGGGSPLDPGFSVTFSGAALAVTAAPGTTSTTFSSFSPPSGGGGSGGSSSPSFGGSSSGSVNGIGPVTPTTAAPAPPTTVAATGGEAFAPPEFAAGATPGDGGGKKQPWQRLLLLVPLSAAIGVGTVYGKRILQQRGVLEEA
jgi:hypothetical protein